MISIFGRPYCLVSLRCAQQPKGILNTAGASFRCSFTTSSCSSSKPLPPRPSLPDSDLRHVFLKGSGPGGQKINKTSSAAQITHVPTGIVVKSQATRSQSQNYKIARQILADKVELLQKGDDSRLAQKGEKKAARKKSREKKSKKKYRALEEAKKGETPQGIESTVKIPEESATSQSMAVEG